MHAELREISQRNSADIYKPDIILEGTATDISTVETKNVVAAPTSQTFVEKIFSQFCGLLTKAVVLC